MKLSWFPNPPQTSPSAIPALGVGLCYNTLLFSAFYFGLNMVKASTEAEMLITYYLSFYALFSLPAAILYGVSAAAWVGWSWWRVPLATLSATVFGWCLNVLGFIFWTSAINLKTKSSFDWGSFSYGSLLGPLVLSGLGLIIIFATLLSRYLNNKALE